MSWLRKGPGPPDTALAMVGAKAGDRVLVIGAGDGGLAAALALVTGLNGRTLVVDPSPEAEARVESAAAKAGALVEFHRAPATRLPLDAASFDIVVVQRGLAAPVWEPSHVVSDAARVLREGGRVLVIEGARRAGVLAALKPPAGPTIESVAVRDLLAGAGLRAARVLAETEGVLFVEAIKPRRDTRS